LASQEINGGRSRPEISQEKIIMSDFESGTTALLTKHEDRIECLEQRLEQFQFALILALKQSGIDLVKAMTFVESRVPTIDVPVAEPVLTTNQKLKPGPSGIIAPPPGGGGDGG
jgi:hypothetical protein